jgi:hypothetical protein
MRTTKTVSLLSGIVLVAGVAHAAPKGRPLPRIANDEIVLAPGWLAEDAKLVAELPDRALVFEDSWSPDGRCYYVLFADSKESQVDAVFKSRKATTNKDDAWEVRGRGYSFTWTVNLGPGLQGCWQHPRKEVQADAQRVLDGLAALDGVRPLLARLGAPITTRLMTNHGGENTLTLDYEAARVDLGAATHWLEQNGFAHQARAEGAFLGANVSDEWLRNDAASKVDIELYRMEDSKEQYFRIGVKVPLTDAQRAQ